MNKKQFQQAFKRIQKKRSYNKKQTMFFVRLNLELSGFLISTRTIERALSDKWKGDSSKVYWAFSKVFK